MSKQPIPPAPIFVPLPPVRTFRIRRYGYDMAEKIPASEMFLGVEAHRLEQADNGNIMFYRYTSAEMTPEGVVYSFKIERLIAAGTYTDMEEITEQFELRPAVS